MDRTFAFFMIVLFIPASSAAENLTRVVGDSLTWAQCVEQAQVNNPDLRAAERQWRAALDQEKAASSDYFPQLAANLGYAQGTSSINGVNGEPTVTANTTSYSTSLTATQNLFAGFQDQAKIEQARAARQISEAAYVLAKANASFALKSAFMGVIYEQNLIQLTNDIYKRREYNLRMVQLRFESGGENKGSLLLSRAYLEQAKYERLQAENGLQLAIRQLRKVLGQENEENGNLTITGNVPTQEPPTQVDLQELALQTPAYLQSVYQSASAQAGITLSQAGFYPSLNLTGSIGKTGVQWAPNNDRWSVGVNLSFPLFNGDRDYFGQRSASETYRAAEFMRKSVGHQMIEALQQALSGYSEAVQKVSVDQSFVEASTAREKIAREKYNNGLLTFDDWDIIETDLINRQKTALQSQRDRIVNEATFEQVQGKGVFR